MSAAQGPPERSLSASAAPGAAPGLAYKSATGRWVLAATVLGSGIAALDATVVGIALPAIGKDFHAPVSSMQWVVDGYTLTLAGMLLLGGALGDAYGRRKVFVIGTVWFAVASLICGLAPGTGILIAARALQGVGGALLTPGSLAILQASFTPDDRPRAIGAWSGLGGVATAIGPFLGGYLISAVSWRLVFYINLPLAAAVIAISLRHVPESRAPGPRKPIDVMGAITISLALAGITYGLIEASESGWTSPPVLTSLLAGVVLFVAFLRVEAGHPNAMLPLSVFRSRQFSAANAVTFVVYGALGGALFLVPVVLQEVCGYSALEAGTALLPITAIMLAFSARSAALSARIGPRLQMTVGPLVIAAGLGPVHEGGGQRGLPDPGAARGSRVRFRAGDQRGAAHRDRAGRRARRARRHRLGGQQRRGADGEPDRGGHPPGARRHHRRQLPAPGGADQRVPQSGADRGRGVGGWRRARLRDHPQSAPCRRTVAAAARGRRHARVPDLRARRAAVADPPAKRRRSGRPRRIRSAGKSSEDDRREWS